MYAHLPTVLTVYNQGLPFSQIKHQITTVDAQPSNEAGGILVLVTGALLVCHLLGEPRIFTDHSIGG